ncbi:MAG: NAD(P)H-hydrate dehydratase [Planctomycetes bacterium]|nr:NAD(P)H-hydrate dehydratase [Planctomycetota bacterium]
MDWSLSNLEKIPRIHEVPLLAKRPTEAHKGMFGHALLVGGKPGMTGAISIAGQLALRSGAGLVTVAVPGNVQACVAAGNPCLMTLGLPESSDGSLAGHACTLILARNHPGTFLAVGPGLGRSSLTDAMIETLYHQWMETAVIDADGLNALSDSESWKKACQESMRTQQPSATANQQAAVTTARRILTPHPGEWERLCGVATDQPLLQRAAAVQIAASLGLVVVLKGHHTLVTDGHQMYENRTGNPSLAVGGSGDALTGIIVAMLCQGLPPLDASILGVYLHGLAADIAHKTLGTPSTLATDLLVSIPVAFRSLETMNKH